MPNAKYLISICLSESTEGLVAEIRQIYGRDGGFPPPLFPTAGDYSLRAIKRIRT